MNVIPITTCLQDGPLMTDDERRSRTIERMGKTLLERDGLGTEARSRDTLTQAGYPPFLVMALYRDARASAFQEIAAEEMSKP